MTDNKHSNRIPFEDIDSSTAWNFPSWDDGAKVVSSVKKKTAAQEKSGVESIEDVEDHSPQPMTAQQLQQISEEAEREGREHGYKEGYEQGFAEGEKKGVKLGEQKAYKEVKQRLDEQSDRFRELADALMNPVAMQDGDLENLILDMAVHFAKHLINKELTEDPTSLFNIVRRAAASLPAGAQNIRIYLHADDVELAHEAFSGSGRDWTFYSDAELSRGGCRIESSQSLIDYSIEKRLQQMLDEIHYQGEVEPESLTPVADYRPQEPLVQVTAEAPHELAGEDTEAGEQDALSRDVAGKDTADGGDPGDVEQRSAGSSATQGDTPYE